MKKKKIIGIDYGDFTIGLAIFDLETDFIFPYKTICRSKANVLRKSIREIVNIIHIENITDIVIGLPLNADGTEGDRVEKVKNFARMLKNGLINSSFIDSNTTHTPVGANMNGIGGKHREPAIVGAKHREPVTVGAKLCEPAVVGAKHYEPASVGAKQLDELNEYHIYFQDEHLTTVEAKTILSEQGIKKSEWKKTIDQIAAEIILKDFKQAHLQGQIYIP